MSAPFSSWTSPKAWTPTPATLPKFIADALRHKAPDDLAGIIVFGRQPIVEIAPSDLRRLPPFHAAPDRTATDIASALRLAMGLFPDGFARRIVLLSDGNETDGDSLAVAQVAKSEGIPIDVVPCQPVGLSRRFWSPMS